MSKTNFPELENFKGELLENGQIFHLQITGKTMKINFFPELRKSFEYIQTLEDIRCVLLTSACKHFTTGLDLMDAAQSLQTEEGADAGRAGIEKYNMLKDWQGSFNLVQSCRVPVICGIDNYCIGGGIDLICNADIRVCTEKSLFTVKEVDIGLCADLGTTQKMPLVCSNDSKLRELMFTGRIFNHLEAKEIGLISHYYKNKEEMLQKMLEMAKQIASKSPVAIWTIKNVMNHQQLQNSEANLRYMQAINAGMLQTQDIKIAGMASISKKAPVYPKL